jgi:hypothetical protein
MPILASDDDLSQLGKTQPKTRVQMLHEFKSIAEQLDPVEIVDALQLAKLSRELKEISDILCQRV